jgi:hypothetical protein
VRQVELAWNRLDARVVAMLMGRFRNDGDGPFRIEVQPGRYKLTVTAPSRAEHRDTFLVKTACEVEVPLQGRELTVPIVHGGRLRVTMTDRAGRFAHGGVSITVPRVGTRPRPAETDPQTRRTCCPAPTSW